jgi:thiol-disulfide isomerase/thioredoxin
LLIKEVARSYRGRVNFISQDWGESELAARYGIKRYPVVFVDEVLVAQPKDFGGWGEKGGKYAPWRDTANHEKFKRDLSHMIDLLLRGDRELAEKSGSTFSNSTEIAALPAFSVQDVAGRKIESEKLMDKVVVVEFWATWCLPCRSTLGWLAKTKRQYGDKVAVIAVALESEEGDVRKLARSLGLPMHVVMGQREMAAQFGDFSSVPTMFVFDRQGRTASVFYGAPKDLHKKVGRLVASLIEGTQSSVR